ncbi:MAG: glucuronate isomerase [Spirochaetes bacterium]|nr:glucuronate isomerase [Spirochaetota bacterium]MBU1079791.1 glucuronate isomerase [Spirochaetota bacterium]
MEPFMSDDFLLRSEPARKLYHDYAAGMPIFDYHCHVPPRQIAENARFENLTQVWLRGDHYKWRAMRACGVPETHITGDAPDREKFRAWAHTVPKTLGNPLYHWTHLELRRAFGVDELLSPASADRIYDRCSELLAQDDYRARGLLERFNLSAVCSTDDPADDLGFHDAMAEDASLGIKVLPAFRPDKAHALEHPGHYAAWIRDLEEASGGPIGGYAALIAALNARHDYFHARGCRLSDHGLTFVPGEAGAAVECDAIFRNVMAGNSASRGEIQKFRGAVLTELGRMDADSGWAMQLHLGAMRGVNGRTLAALGPDTGYDAIGDWPQAEGLAALLDRLDADDRLPKTILYALNPRDNEVLASMIGAFQGGSVAAKMQFGSGWWFNDQKDGMERQLTALASMGLLSTFVGMTTDSRSFLSYPRHEYFRRILCDLVGGWMERGEIPDDLDLAGGMVKDISFRNASTWFGVDLARPRGERARGDDAGGARL